MSSPLAVFRKYQAAFLVVFGVMLMVAFVIAPPILDYLQTRSVSRANGEDPVVVQTAFGSLQESELNKMRQAHNAVEFYLREIMQRVQQQGGEVQDPGIMTPASDRSLVYTYLLAKKAESMGLVVSNDAVLEFLEQFSGFELSRAELGAVLRDTLGDRFPEESLLEQLRVELLALRMREMGQAGMGIAPNGTVTPGMAWRYFKRLNRQVQAEVVPLEVEEFVEKVDADPSEAEIQQLYDEGIDRYPHPDVPEPGFKVRRKAVFQYVKADFNQLVEEEKAKLIDGITDEEIEQHYERNKQRYTVPQSPAESTPDATPGEPAPATEGDAAAPSAPSTEDPTTEDPSAQGEEQKDQAAGGEQDQAEKAAAEAAKDDVEKAEGTAPEANPAVEEKPAEDLPNSEGQEQPETNEKSSSGGEAQPAQEEPAEESADGTANQADGSASVASPDGRTFFVNAVLQDQEEIPVLNAPQTDAKPPAPRSQEPADSNEAAAGQEPDESSDESQAEQAADATAEQDEAETPAEQPEEGDAAAAGQPAGAEQSGQTADAEEQPQYRPLDDELRKEIREELAEDRARALAEQRIKETFADVGREVDQVASEYRKFEIRKERDLEEDVAGKKQEKEFKQHLQVSQLELGEAFEAEETGEEDAISIQDLEIGKTTRWEDTSWPPTQTPFWQIAFDENLAFYLPSDIRGEDQVRFLFWKIKEEPPYEPELDEVSDEVVRAWKKQKALELAKARAQELIEQAKGKEKPLQEVLGENGPEVTDTNAFTWMSTGFTPSGMGASQLTLSDIEGIEGENPEMMKKIFSLEKGEVGMVVNQPHSAVYVVRIASESPDEEALRSRFLQSGLTPEIRQVAYRENIELQQQWYEDLEKELNVTWNTEAVTSDQ